MSLHTSFLRVISHHELSRRLQPAYHWLTSTTGTSCSSAVDLIRVRRRRQSLSQPESQPEEIDLVHHQMDQPPTFGDFDHGPETSHGRTPS